MARTLTSNMRWQHDVCRRDTRTSTVRTISIVNRGYKIALTSNDQSLEVDADEAGVVFAFALNRFMRSAAVSGRAAARGSGAAGCGDFTPRTCLMSRSIDDEHNAKMNLLIKKGKSGDRPLACGVVFELLNR